MTIAFSFYGVSSMYFAFLFYFNAKKILVCIKRVPSVTPDLGLQCLLKSH